MEKAIIGIDLGGTNFRIGAVNGENLLIAPAVVKTSIVAEAERPLEKICQVIEEYMEENHIQAAEAISIGVPSSVMNDKETVICTTNIRNKKGEPIFSHMNIAKDIQRRFRVPVYVNNDVNNIMLYDVMKNHLERKKAVVGIYIGTGVGSAVMLNGKFLEGKDGAELDLGHIPYFGGDAPCSCGKKGCCECYASGWKLQQIRKEFYPETPIGDMFTLHKNEKPLREFIFACSVVYALMATIFNPDAVIVGGGVTEMPDFPRKEFEDAVNRNTGKDVMSFGFDYVYSKEFVGKGVIGAAMFARRKLKERADRMDTAV